MGLTIFILLCLICLFGLLCIFISMVDEDISAILTGALITVVSLFLLNKILAHEGYSGNYVEYRVDHIMNLNDTTVTTGGRYYVSENNTYKYYRKHNGGYELKSIPSDSTTIYYSSNSPRVEILFEELNKDSFTKFFKSIYSQHVKYNVYIPKGSISNSFILDAKK